MEGLFAQYKKWREETDDGFLTAGEGDALDDKKAFMCYAGLKRLDEEDFEELEMQYDEYLIEMETED